MNRTVETGVCVTGLKLPAKPSNFAQAVARQTCVLEVMGSTFGWNIVLTETVCDIPQSSRTVYFPSTLAVQMHIIGTQPTIINLVLYNL
jgi:hypothetical protein